MVLAAFLALLCCLLLHILCFLRDIALAFNDLHLHANNGDKSARGKCFSKYRILGGLPEIKKQRAHGISMQYVMSNAFLWHVYASARPFNYGSKWR